MQGLVQLKSYLYTKLSVDTSLNNLMNGVNIYDLVQENANLPYIAYGQISSRSVHQLDAEMVEHVVKFAIVAKADSSLTTHNMMARMEQIFTDLLIDEDLSGGYRLASAELVATQIEQVDFELVKGQMELKLVVEGGV